MFKKGMWLASLMMMLFPALALAEEAAPTVESVNSAVGMANIGLNSLWVMIAAILVIFMQAGFIMLETGSTRMKNAGHVAGKTIFTFGLATLVFWMVG
jgi:Amt family ammonium transporter